MSEFMYTKQELFNLQSLPLQEKLKLTRERIREWYEEYDGHVYVSFSGGKDSTALLHMVRTMYPEVPAVFSNTGLEFPEIRQFALAQDNVTEIRPELTFVDVVKLEGYPLVSKTVAATIKAARKDGLNGKHRRYMVENVMVQLKNGKMGRSMFDKTKWRLLAEEAPFKISDRCCMYMKKRPMKKYEKETGRHGYIGTMAIEGALRERAWMQHGCNAFDTPHGHSTPLAFWTEQDILQYIQLMGIEIAPVYGEIESKQLPNCEQCKYRTTGADRTGCVFCGFGAHLEKQKRFLNLKVTHPKLYRYCIDGGEWIDNPDYDPNLPEVAPDGFRLWNPPRLWMPSSKGLGLGYVFDTINSLYGKTMIPY